MNTSHIYQLGYQYGLKHGHVPSTTKVAFHYLNFTLVDIGIWRDACQDGVEDREPATIGSHVVSLEQLNEINC